MKFKFILVVAFLFTVIATAQNINAEGIVGEWNVTNVEIPGDVSQKGAVKFIEDAFLGATFNFNGNTIFNIEFGEKADEQIEELFFLDGENWKIKEDQILIGRENNGFSTMHIEIAEIKGKTYFKLPMMRLEMEKIKSGVLTEVKASENKDDYPVYDSQVEEVIIITEEINEGDIIPFIVIENPPLAPDCKEKWDSSKKKECTSRYIQVHVQKKFNTDLASELGLIGKTRIDVQFIINKEGRVVNIVANGAPEVMNQNAVDVVGLLPTFIPASKNGIPVAVSYSLPILFQVQ